MADFLAPCIMSRLQSRGKDVSSIAQENEAPPLSILTVDHLGNSLVGGLPSPALLRAFRLLIGVRKCGPLNQGR